MAGIKKMSNANIMTFTGLKKSFVDQWAAAGRASSEDVKNKPQAGRPYAISPNGQKRLKRALCNTRFVTPAKLAFKFK